MRKDIRRLAVEAQARPLTNEDVAMLKEHAQRVSDSLLIADECKEKEYMVIYPTYSETYKKWKEKLQEFKNYPEKVLRDTKLVYRYCIYSVILDDPDYSQDRMNYWFRTIINAFGFGQELMADTYMAMQRRADRFLGSNRCQPMHDMLDQTVAVWKS